MTEMEKARAGLEFIRGDAQLRRIRERAESLCFRLNHTPPEEKERREEILRALIPNQGENCSIKPPFLCDYGEFIVLGRNFFANCFNVFFLFFLYFFYNRSVFFLYNMSN